MTVNDDEMKVPTRATRAGDDNAHKDRWKKLPDLRDGRRENWMTDRAKNALGTAK